MSFSMSNIGCSTLGVSSAVGAGACLYQAANTVNNAMKEMDQAPKSYLQRAIDSVIGEPAHKASHVVRHLFEGALWATVGVALGAVSASALDPTGTVPDLFGARCSQDSKKESTTSFQDLTKTLVENLNSGASKVSGFMDGAYDATLGRLDKAAFGGNMGKTGNAVLAFLVKTASNHPVKSMAIGGAIAGRNGVYSLYRMINDRAAKKSI
ncbi:MAG: hypothetical protein S4CHLAM7_00490 [Chlamydiae bacterium]|nr:hypothetical protein [Chlamydiota bacterium]